MTNTNIQARIKARREELRITQTEFAELLGVSRSCAINLETTTRFVNPRLSDIARVLEMTEEELIFGQKTDEQQNRLFESYAEERLKEQRAQIVDGYEKLLDEKDKELRATQEINNELRDHNNTLKQLNQWLDSKRKND